MFEIVIFRYSMLFNVSFLDIQIKKVVVNGHIKLIPFL